MNEKLKDFLYRNQRKAGQGLGTRLVTLVLYLTYPTTLLSFSLSSFPFLPLFLPSPFSPHLKISPSLFSSPFSAFSSSISSSLLPPPFSLLPLPPTPHPSVFISLSPHLPSISFPPSLLPSSGTQCALSSSPSQQEW